MKLVLAVLLIAPLACADQKPADVERGPTPEERATLVESRILTSVHVEGRPEAAFTLEERMEFYGVPGASVAVLNDGRIEWARGYGLKDVATGEPVDEHTLFQQPPCPNRWRGSRRYSSSRRGSSISTRMSTST